MALQHEPEARGKQDVAVFASLALIDENPVSVQVEIDDPTSHQLAHLDSRVEEKFEHDFMLDVAAFLNDLKESLQVALT